MATIDDDFIQNQSKRFLNNFEQFVAKRDVSATELANYAKRQYPNAKHVLFTSSPIQGCATATSDIDLIVIIPGQELSSGMATQFYMAGNHCEIAAVSDEDLQHDLQVLTTLNTVPLSEVALRVENWDNYFRLKKKYLERVVNGLSIDQGMPFAGYLSPLSALWACQALLGFAESYAALQLAFKSQEPRAAVIYAIDVVLAIMDVLLCRAGYVYSNKKWITTRWHSYSEKVLSTCDNDFPDGILSGHLAILYRLIGQPLSENEYTALQVLGDRFCYWLRHDRALGFQGLQMVPAPTYSQKISATLSLIYTRNRVCLLNSEIMDRIIDFSEISHLNYSEAGEILRALRANMLLTKVKK
ncbi:DUF6001 family protein [Erwinia mallotivora]|uniref:DUF6001 family protein n=1 Tax=Erwinia mallotivora TaxID=69222 RepID=UPI0035EB1756